MPKAAATNRESEPALTILFQGLCAFIRNQRRPEDTTEVTAALIAGENANEHPPLCAHTPVLIFRESDFVASEAPDFHSTAVVPVERPSLAAPSQNPECSRALPALGVWRLAGRELSIKGAQRRNLELLPTFRKVADVNVLTGDGAASHDGAGAARGLVSCRVFLTDGTLSSSAAVGETDDPADQWVFDVENARRPTGTPVVFSQEVRYRYYVTRARTVTLIGQPMGGRGRREILTLFRGATIAISNLCAIVKMEVDKERDFLAYYSLLATDPARRLIPHRLRRGPVKVGSSACPPSALYLKRARRSPRR